MFKVILVALLLSVNVFAVDPMQDNFNESGFRTAAKRKINELVAGATDGTSIGAGVITEAQLVDNTGEGNYIKRVARFYYNVATDGGSVGAKNLGVSLPAKALITRSYLNIDTAFVHVNTAGTVALSCEDANNIKTATNLASLGAAKAEGASTGTVASMVTSIGAACNITATVASGAQSAGKLTGWVEYEVVD